MLQAPNNAACCRLPMLQCCTLPTCGDAALDRTASYFQMKLPAAMLPAPYAAMLQAANMWRYRTASCFRARLPTAMLQAAYQCCWLPAAHLPTCRVLLAENCRAEKLPAENCLLTDSTLYIQLQSGHALTAGSLAQSSRLPPGDS
jgi:hypothetical protein